MERKTFEIGISGDVEGIRPAMGQPITPIDSDEHAFPGKTVMIGNFALDTAQGGSSTRVRVVRNVRVNGPPAFTVPTPPP